PLAVIETTTDVLIANASETIESQSKWLHYIKIETDRMSKLISNLLYLAKVDNNETVQTFFEYNLSESITTACLPLESLIFETGQHFDFEIEPDIFFTGEEESIKQVAIILLDNAMKYCSVEGEIKVALHKTLQGISLSVSNTGDGIAPEHLSKIFERFYRIDDSRTRETGGYGLGLSIAKSIIKQHHGTISVTSVPNELTTFKVSLPVKK
ncbi:MAG: sensor histidine kinase, partial [Turicibacter sp.]